MAEAAITKSILAYNQLRPHASCDYLTPVQAHQQDGPLKKHSRKYEKKNPGNTNQLSKNVNRTSTIKPVNLFKEHTFDNLSGDQIQMGLLPLHLVRSTNVQIYKSLSTGVHLPCWREQHTRFSKPGCLTP